MSVDIELPDIKFPSFAQHAKSKSMWKGSSVVSENSTWVLCRESNKKIFKRQNINFSEALLKCFDEILVNAIDQYINTVNYPEEYGGPVTEIKLWFDKKTGAITITNNGQGMPVYVHNDLGGKYTVEGLITREFGGSNFDDKTHPDRVTGGTNGLGIKIVNIDSVYFEVETVDQVNKKYYRQVCEDRMSVIHEPTVIDLKSATEQKKLNVIQSAPHTTIKFIPNYAELCKISTNQPDPLWFSEVNAANFQKVLEFRAYQAATFIASISYRYENQKRIEYKRKAKVYFNGEELKIKNLNDFAKMFDVALTIPLSFEQSREEVNEILMDSDARGNELIQFPWQVVIGFNKTKKFERMSILNGVHLIKGGSHCDMLLNQIVEALKPRAEKVTKESAVAISASTLKNMLFIFDCKQIPIPQFQGQVKESIKIGTAELNKMKKAFQIPKATIDKIWKMVREDLEMSALSSKKKKNNKVVVRKYVTATKFGPKTMCFIPEGDSAAKIVRDIIHSRQSPVDYRYCGLYNIGGVPMNARKQVKKIIRNDKEYIHKSEKLMKNIGLQGLVQVLGLDYDEDYYYGPPDEDAMMHPEMSEEEVQGLGKKRERGDKMFEKLRYGGGIIISTDQDLDGIGQICSLILVFIMCFWPELIKRGYVKRLATPIVRVYHGNDATNFYSEQEFENWVNEKFGSILNLPSAYKVNYYKGLSTHTEDEVLKDIGTNLLKNIYTFTWDDACAEYMEIMYGPETRGRKSLLVTPVDRNYNQLAFLRKKISVTDHFLKDAKSFQLEFMRRKLKCAIDGLLPSQRKAVAGVRNSKKTGKIKVYQLTGAITEKMKYQHGGPSMDETITKMAQTFTGSNNIPLFIPISNGFGDRVNGRGETGSSRYINTKYNAKVMNKMFPLEDDCLLDYEFEDGQQCEPKYYIPILPYSILETTTTVGVGWNISCWARDLDTVLKAVRDMIHGPITTPESMLGKVWLPKGMKVVIGNYPSSKIKSEICLGSLKVNSLKNKILITQLPLKMWSFHLECRLLGKDVKSERIKNTGQTRGKAAAKGPRAKPTSPSIRKPRSPKSKSVDPDQEGNNNVDNLVAPGSKPVVGKELVKNILDHTANDKNHILISLEPGSIEYIKKNYGNEFISPIEDYLGLSQQMLPQLNMIVEGGHICEFPTYESVVEHWFPLRKKLYDLRIQRIIILIQLKIELNENILRFIKMDSTKEINIDKDFDDEARAEILQSFGFVKFNDILLNSPKFTKIIDLEKFIKGDPHGSYDYIDKITISMKSKKQIVVLEEKIKTLKDELAEMKKQTWQSLWLTEIDELEKIIRKGIASRWLYSDNREIVFK